MENSFAVSAGIWKIEQNTDTMEIVLFKYGHEVGRWEEEQLLSWTQLHDMLLRESYLRRGEK